MKKMLCKLAVVLVLCSGAIISSARPAEALCASESCFSLRVQFCNLRWGAQCFEGPHDQPSAACTSLEICYSIAADACGCLMY